MDKITFTSTKALLNPGRFAIGILTDGEIHFNPVHGILHVKPSFPYLDKSDKSLKETGNEAGDFRIGISMLVWLTKLDHFINCFRVRR